MFIVEPAAWRAYVGFGQDPPLLWLAELAVGIAILGWFVGRWRSQGNRVKV